MASSCLYDQASSQAQQAFHTFWTIADMENDGQVVAGENRKLSCVVCDDDADTRHYGRYSCQACKVFFLRHHGREVQSMRRAQNCNGKCLITHQHKTHCQRCRLQKCFQAKMVYTHGRRKAHKKISIMSDTLSEEEATTSIMSTCSSQDQSLLNESTYDQSYLSAWFPTAYNMIWKPDGLNWSPKEVALMSELAHASLVMLFNYPHSDLTNACQPSLSSSLEKLRAVCRIFVEHVKHLTHFMQLSDNCQLSLIKNNHGAWQAVRCFLNIVDVHNGIVGPNGNADMFNGNLANIEIINGRPPHVAVFDNLLLRLFKELPPDTSNDRPLMLIVLCCMLFGVDGTLSQRLEAHEYRQCKEIRSMYECLLFSYLRNKCVDIKCTLASYFAILRFIAKADAIKRKQVDKYKKLVTTAIEQKLTIDPLLAEMYQ